MSPEEKQRWDEGIKQIQAGIARMAETMNDFTASAEQACEGMKAFCRAIANDEALRNALRERHL